MYFLKTDSFSPPTYEHVLVIRGGVITTAYVTSGGVWRDAYDNSVIHEQITLWADNPMGKIHTKDSRDIQG